MGAQALENVNGLEATIDAIATLLLGLVGPLSLQALQSIRASRPRCTYSPEKHDVSKSVIFALS